jgi:DNA-binding NarL/FixJ family response regulator
MKASKKKILLIDPSEPNGSEFRAVLCGLDFQIIDLQNTIIATQKVIEELPHIVCCNHKLPEFSGFQMYNILEDTLQKKQIPFLLILPCMDKISLLMGEELGIDGYIFPPFEPEEVNNILYTQLQKKEKRFTLEEKKFKTLCKIAPYSIFVTENGKIIEANTKFYELSGIDITDGSTVFITDVFNFNSTKKEELKFIRFINGLTKLNCFNNIPLVSRPDELFHIYFSYIEDSYTPIRMLGTAIPVELKKQASEILKSLIPSKQKIKKATAFSKDIFTKREAEILELSATGTPIKHIADRLGISIRTVEKHRSNLIHKTKTNNIMEAVFLARKNGLLDIY